MTRYFSPKDAEFGTFCLTDDLETSLSSAAEIFCVVLTLEHLRPSVDRRRTESVVDLVVNVVVVVVVDVVDPDAVSVKEALAASGR